MAELALEKILDAGARLAECYAEQALAMRRRHLDQRPCFLGGDLGVSPLDERSASQFLAAFGAARVPLAWREVETSEGSRDWDVFDRQVEWCRANRLIVCGGPLLQLAPGHAPDWLYLFEDDFAGLQASVSDFVDATVTRYRGRVDLWQCAGRTNTADFLSLGEEELVQLTAHVIEQTRSLDPETPLVVSFDQPWAEYVSRREVDFPPFYFADALVRANLGLAGLMLEINLGLSAGRHAAARPVGVQPPVGPLGGAGDAAVHEPVRSQRDRRRPVGPEPQPPDPAGMYAADAAGVAQSLPADRAGEDLRAGRILDAACTTTRRTTSPTAACSISAATPSRPCERWPRCGKRSCRVGRAERVPPRIDDPCRSRMPGEVSSRESEHRRAAAAAPPTDRRDAPRRST